MFDDAPAIMAKTYTGQMVDAANNILGGRKSVIAVTRNSLANRTFTNSGNRGGTAAGGSRRLQKSRNTASHFKTAMSNFQSKSRGLNSAASLEVLQRNLNALKKSPSPELEK